MRGKFCSTFLTQQRRPGGLFPRRGRFVDLFSYCSRLLSAVKLSDAMHRCGRGASNSDDARAEASNIYRLDMAVPYSARHVEPSLVE